MLKGLSYSVFNHKIITIINKERRGKLLEEMDMFMIYNVVMFHGFILTSKLIKLYTLNMYSFLYINYTLIKWFKEARTHKKTNATHRGSDEKSEEKINRNLN